MTISAWMLMRKLEEPAESEQHDDDYECWSIHCDFQTRGGL